MIKVRLHVFFKKIIPIPPRLYVHIPKCFLTRFLEGFKGEIVELGICTVFVFIFDLSSNFQKRRVEVLQYQLSSTFCFQAKNCDSNNHFFGYSMVLANVDLLSSCKTQHCHHNIRNTKGGLSTLSTVLAVSNHKDVFLQHTDKSVIACPGKWVTAQCFWGCNQAPQSYWKFLNLTLLAFLAYYEPILIFSIPNRCVVVVYIYCNPTPNQNPKL